MSSITTAVPSGIIANGPDWCVQNLIDIFGSDVPPYTYNECFNTTRGTEKSSFETFCCDGHIIDTSSNLWSGSVRNLTSYELNLENLVCCRTGGQRLPGGLLPIDDDYTHCSPSEVPTPLASLAATNTDNAALFLVTYESASQVEGTEFGDWVVTETPMCLWVETASDAVSLTEITVPVAEITTLPPPTTDHFGNTIDPSTGSLNDGSDQPTGKGSTRTQSASGANASSPSPTSAPDVPPTTATTPSSGYSVQADRSFLLPLFGIALGLSALMVL